MDGETDRDLTAALAAFVHGLDFDALSQADVNQVGGLILDHLGCCLHGSRMPWGLALADWARDYDSAGECTIFGTGLRVTPPVAGLVNATAAHGLEFDDTHDRSVSHPGAVIVATALAVGAAGHVSGRELVAAIVAGYETMARVGMATGAAAVIERGFHPTALFGGFGAVATAARLRQMDMDAVRRAWGLVLSMAGGSMEFSQDARGTTVKRLHGGYAAHNGILAAELAGFGIAGPSRALDGRYGLCRLYGPDPDMNPDLGKLRPDGAKFEIHRVSLKPYPCCRLFHSTIDALREVTADFSLPLEAIKGIRVGGPAILVSQHMMRRPTSMMAAQYSLPYTLAAAMLAGPEDYKAFAPQMLNDERILGVADRVEAVADDAMEEAFPEHFGSWVELELDGGRRRSEVLDSFGTPANPMSAAILEEKFTRLVAASGIGLNADAVIERVKTFEHCDDVTALTGMLVPAANQQRQERA